MQPILTEKEKLLIPAYRFTSVLDITPEILYNIGIKGIALDIDNTLIPDGRFKISEDIYNWLNMMKQSDIPLLIISNGSKFRVGYIAKKLGNMSYIHMAKKPSAKSLLKGAEILGIDITQLAMIGDQLTSDVKAANSCGAVSIRVDPLPNSMYPLYYKIKARQEKPYLAYYEKYIRNEN